MLVDYDIERSEPKDRLALPFAQFVLAIVFIQCVIFLFSASNLSEVQVTEDTLRYRIIANSNSTSDQELKNRIQMEIQPLLTNALSTASNEKEVEKNLIEIEKEIIGIASALSLPKGQAISFERTNALIPPKYYGGIIFPQNYYDAYVLTIGSGKGDNFFCALFPNVCYPEKTKEETEKPKFFVWEWLKKVFS